jgi:outer membrane lipoprotein SlyB
MAYHHNMDFFNDINKEGLYMKTGMISAVIIFALSAFFWGCETANQGSRTFTPGQAQTALSVYFGTVLNVAEVQIQHDTSPAGGIGGAVVGGIVGSTIGSGRGQRLATTGGALAGAAAGNAAARNRATRAALEIEVEMDDGRLMVIVQEKDDEFLVGDRIRLVVSPDGTMRVRQ